MERGHAEALMPLLDRLIKRSGGRFRRARQDRGRRSGPAASPGCASRSPPRAPSLSGTEQALRRRDHALGLCRARRRGGRRHAGGDRHRRAAQPRLPAGLRPGRPHGGDAPHRPGARRRAAARHRLGAHRRVRRRDAGRPRRPPSASTPRCWRPGPAPDIVWIARLGAVAVPERAPPKPFYLRPPDAKPQDHVRIPRR